MLITVTSRRTFGWCWTWRSAGRESTAPLYAQPELWAFWMDCRSRTVQCSCAEDSHWGAEKAMMGAEERKLGYLFKLKQSEAKKLIGQIFPERGLGGSGATMARERRRVAVGEDGAGGGG